jgi:hypothetical protein
LIKSINKRNKGTRKAQFKPDYRLKHFAFCCSGNIIVEQIEALDQSPIDGKNEKLID